MTEKSAPDPSLSDRLREAEGILDALLFVETLDELERGKAVITEFLSRQPDRVIRDNEEPTT